MHRKQSMINAANNTANQMLKQYIKLGDNYKVDNYDDKYYYVGKWEAKYLPDNFFIDFINSNNKLTLEKETPSYIILNMCCYIFNDILIKRRSNKINKILNNIHEK